MTMTAIASNISSKRAPATPPIIANLSLSWVALSVVVFIPSSKESEAYQYSKF